MTKYKTPGSVITSQIQKTTSSLSICSGYYVKHERRATPTSPVPNIGERGSLAAAALEPVLAGAVAVAVLTTNGIIGDPAAAQRVP